MKKSSQHPRILLTNDDGIQAPGLEVLYRIACQFSADVSVVAPEHDESGTGQSLSLHQPLRCRSQKEGWWAVSGTPADCVAIAIGHVMKKRPPDLILSGVNAGANTGDDVNLSGTLGGAFMGLMLGFPAIALSLQCGLHKDKAHWDTVLELGHNLLRHFFNESWPEQSCLSINIPNRPTNKIKGLSWAPQGNQTTKNVVIKQRKDLRDKSYFWMTTEDKEVSAKSKSDQALLDKGDIVVTALGLNRTIEIAQTRISLNDIAGDTPHG